MDGQPIDWQEFSHQKKLDISKRGLVALKGISKCKELTWLNLSANAIESLHWLKKSKKLVVLNASNNKISSVHHILHLQDLKALILNNNCLESVEGIEKLTSLNSLVLSKNDVETIDVSNFTLMTKLSLSHNKFKEAPDLTNLTSLKELRLNDNEIEDIPKSFSRCKSLRLADFGNNKISSFGILDILSKTNVENLNLKGNQICSFPDYKAKVISALPNLKVLDGRRIDRQAKDTNPAESTKVLAASEKSPKFPVPADEIRDKDKGQDKLVSGSKLGKVGGFVSRFSDISGNVRSSGSQDGLKKAKKGRKKVGDRIVEKPDSERCESKSGGKGDKGDQTKHNKSDENKEEDVKIGSEKCQSETETHHGNQIQIEKKKDKEEKGKENKEVGKRKRKLGNGDTKGHKKKKKEITELSNEEKRNEIKNDKRECESEGGKEVNIRGLGKSISFERNENKAGIKTKTKEKKTKKKKKEVTEISAKVKKKKDQKKPKKLDKRSGVVGLEIIKTKSNKHLTQDFDVFESQQTYSFGAGENDGW